MLSNTGPSSNTTESACDIRRPAPGCSQLPSICAENGRYERYEWQLPGCWPRQRVSDRSRDTERGDTGGFTSPATTSRDSGVPWRVPQVTGHTRLIAGRSQPPACGSERCPLPASQPFRSSTRTSRSCTHRWSARPPCSSPARWRGTSTAQVARPRSARLNSRWRSAYARAARLPSAGSPGSSSRSTASPTITSSPGSGSAFSASTWRFHPSAPARLRSCRPQRARRTTTSSYLYRMAAERSRGGVGRSSARGRESPARILKRNDPVALRQSRPSHLGPPGYSTVDAVVRPPSGTGRVPALRHTRLVRWKCRSTPTRCSATTRND